MNFLFALALVLLEEYRRQPDCPVFPCWVWYALLALIGALFGRLVWRLWHPKKDKLPK